MCGNWTGSAKRVLDLRAVVPQFPRATEAHVAIADGPRPPLTVVGSPQIIAARGLRQAPQTYDPGLMTSCIP
jgi:hypothetical protein